jgi:uncharacterized protein (TIGR03435 family)
MNSSKKLPRQKLRLATTAITAVFITVTTGLTQTPQAPQSPRTTAAPPTFDVVSIKPAKPGCVTVQIGPSPDGFHLQCIPLSALIRYAYGYGAFNDERVLGEPNWIQSTAYDIDAKVDASDADAFNQLTIEQRASMLQAPLKSRFQLAVHHETKDLPVYALILAKGGPKLKESDPNDATTKTLPTMRMRGHGKLEAHHCSIKEMLSFLSPLQGRTIVDRTGLTGNYEFTLTWAPDTMRSDAPVEDEARPSIFTAFQEQLGLRLESQKAPQDVLVIDHVQKPSEN